ncbi:MAG: hypothetical protein OET90_00460 [Desulfuromonadales bacterium]|nr:hypothetical protein [Desulfuromonadales bacterium]
MSKSFRIIGCVLLCCALTFFLNACSDQDEAAQAQAKLEAEKLAKMISLVRQDLDQIQTAALKFKAEKGEDAAHNRAMVEYLEVWPAPPAELRDATFSFEWNYFINGTIGDMGGPTNAQDTVVFLEGVKKDACIEYNHTVNSSNDKIWDFEGKTERPAADSWCENGGNPYRIIQVVSLN